MFSVAATKYHYHHHSLYWGNDVWAALWKHDCQLTYLNSPNFQSWFKSWVRKGFFSTFYNWHFIILTEIPVGQKKIITIQWQLTTTNEITFKLRCSFHLTIYYFFRSWMIIKFPWLQINFHSSVAKKNRGKPLQVQLILDSFFENV